MVYDHLPVLEKNKCRGEIIGNFLDAVRGHKWQQHTKIKRHVEAEEWDFCLAAQILNPVVTASPGRTAEVCSSGSQKGLKALGFTCIRI